MFKISKEEYLWHLKRNPHKVKRTKSCYYLLNKNKWLNTDKKEGDKYDKDKKRR